MSGFQYDRNGPFIIVAVNDNRDYSIDWTALMDVPNSETIATSGFSADPALILGANYVQGFVTTQWISSPTAGSYWVTGTITTNNGREFNRSFRMTVVVDL